MSPAEISAVRDRVTDWSPSDYALAVALNTPAEEHRAPPVPLPQPRLTFAALMTPLSPESIARLGAREALLLKTIDQINEEDVAAVPYWVAMFEAMGDISSTEAAALRAVLDAPPETAPGVLRSWAEVVLGRHLSAADVARCRPDA